MRQVSFMNIDLMGYLTGKLAHTPANFPGEICEVLRYEYNLYLPTYFFVFFEYILFTSTVVII